VHGPPRWQAARKSLIAKHNTQRKNPQPKLRVFEKADYQDYLLVGQLLEIIFTFFTLNVLPVLAPAPELAEEEAPEEAESEPLPEVPITRT
jgi:hypothetical protein